MSGRARKPAFLTAHFLLIFYHFHPFSFISDRFYLLSIDFTHFRLSLFVFNCFKPNLSVYLKTYFYLFLCQFRLFSFISAIFDRFRSLFNILAHISSPLTITTHFRLPLLNFNHFRQFTVTLTHLNCFQAIFTNMNSFTFVIIYI